MKKTAFLILCLMPLLALGSLTSCKEASNGLPRTSKQSDLRPYLKNLPFEVKGIERPEFKNYTRKITEFGGVGDGLADNTAAFAEGMKTVSENGGGYLVVPRGVWYTGPITFENDVNLHLQEGAVVLFSEDYDRYPIVDVYFEGLKTRRCQSPLNARGKTNIAITGFGTIDGNGDAWRWVKKSKVTASQWNALLARGGVTGVAQGSEVWAPTQAIFDALKQANMNVVQFDKEEDWQKYRDFLRPTLLEFDSCKNVLLEGVCFQNSPAWNLHPFMCENVIISNVMVINPWYSQNGDGVDIESCKNVLVVNSKFDVGDDAICIKSGKNQDGRDLQTPCENIVVDGCAVYHGHGGFVVGSEMSSGVRNVSVRNCMFLGTDVGLRFKSARGRGGVVENIYIDNINMINIPTDCILFDLHYTGLSAADQMALEKAAEARGEVLQDTTHYEVTEETPCFRDIYISRVTCRGALRAMYFNGLPEMPVTNINISDAKISSTYGIQIRESEGVTIEDVNLTVEEGEPFSFRRARNVIVNGEEFNVD